MDAPTQAILQDILRRESRSLLQYVSEAFPWITIEEQDALAKLQKLIAEELQAAGGLMRFLTRQRIALPYLGAYPMGFTSINFVSLDYLLPLLVRHQRKAIAELEKDLARISAADARAQAEKILDMKRRHLQTLEGMAAAHPQTVAK